MSFTKRFAADGLPEAELSEGVLAHVRGRATLREASRIAGAAEEDLAEQLRLRCTRSPADANLFPASQRRVADSFDFWRLRNAVERTEPKQTPIPKGSSDGRTSGAAFIGSSWATAGPCGSVTRGPESERDGLLVRQSAFAAPGNIWSIRACGRVQGRKPRVLGRQSLPTAESSIWQLRPARIALTAEGVLRVREWVRRLLVPTVTMAVLLPGAGGSPLAWAAAPGGPGTAVITGFLTNVAQWLQFVAGAVSVCTVAYGGVRHASAHTSHAQAEAWRVILAGLGGLVVALLAPTLVSVVQGLIPS